jgi:hypothetical protein
MAGDGRPAHPSHRNTTTAVLHCTAAAGPPTVSTCEHPVPSLTNILAQIRQLRSLGPLCTRGICHGGKRHSLFVLHDQF